MLTLNAHTVEESTLTGAPADVVRALIADVGRWSRLHRPAIHAEVLEHDDAHDLVRHWALVDEHTVRTWTERREQHDGRITAEIDPVDTPYTQARTEWIAEPDGASTRIRMVRTFQADDPDGKLAAAAREEAAEYLATLKYAAENRDTLAKLIISFDDPLFVAGSVADAYAYLYEADKWEERIPHVARLVLEENVPNIQFFDMDTATPDGRAHTTRSVRVCLPTHKIVYKQIRLPALLDAHTGHWRFTTTPEGVIATARHTATIKPSALPLLGEGTTVEDARKYLRRVLSANSMTNLRLAKAYAEERAGF